MIPDLTEWERPSIPAPTGRRKKAPGWGLLVAFLCVCGFSQNGHAFAITSNLIDEARGVIATKNIAIEKTPINDGARHFGNGEELNWSAHCAGTEPFVMIKNSIIRNGGNVICFAKIYTYALQLTGRLSEIVDAQYEVSCCNSDGFSLRRRWIVDIENINRWHGNSAHFWTAATRYISTFDLVAMNQLIFIDCIDSCRENSNNRSSNSRYQYAPQINRFSEPPSRIEEYIVTGAILGGFAFAAYLVGKGKIP